jgi:serine/threonine protein kinase
MINANFDIKIIEEECNRLKDVAQCLGTASFYEFFSYGGYHVIVMGDSGDYTGEQVLPRIQGPNGLKCFLDIVLQLLFTVKSMHDKDIVHRDLKPANILFNENLGATIIDFGVSKKLPHGNQLMNTRIGTPFYESPELLGNKAYGKEADIWALGCIFYEALTQGKKPFCLPNNPFSHIRNVIDPNFPPNTTEFYNAFLNSGFTKGNFMVNEEDAKYAYNFVAKFLNKDRNKRIGLTEGMKAVADFAAHFGIDLTPEITAQLQRFGVAVRKPSV